MSSKKKSTSNIVAAVDAAVAPSSSKTQDGAGVINGIKLTSKRDCLTPSNNTQYSYSCRAVAVLERLLFVFILHKKRTDEKKSRSPPRWFYYVYFLALPQLFGMPSLPLASRILYQFIRIFLFHGLNLILIEIQIGEGRPNA